MRRSLAFTPLQRGYPLAGPAPSASPRLFGLSARRVARRSGLITCRGLRRLWPREVAPIIRHHGRRPDRSTARSRRMPPVTYPVRFSVEYPDRPLNRLTTFFRLFTAIPILILLCSVSGGTWQWSSGRATAQVAAGAGGLLFFGPLLMILLREKYPRWLLDWISEPGLFDR